MALTINPALRGKGFSWLSQIPIFAIGSFLGALATGSVVSIGLLVAAGLLHTTTLALVLSGAVFYMLLRESGLHVPVPYSASQVPEVLRDVLPASAASFAYGVQLGAGFFTPFTSAAHVAYLTTLPFQRSVATSISVTAAFAASKSIVLFAGAGARSLREIEDRIAGPRYRPGIVRAASFVVSIGVIVALVVAATGRG